jgi:Truncated hemoglobins
MDTAPHRPYRDIVIAERVAATGIDDAMIQSLVHSFYGKVRADAMLGPVFEHGISDWGPHLRTMIDFWSSVALLSGRYHGRPLPVHARLDIGPVHFERWLELFFETTAEVCTPEAAAFFMDRARNIARSLHMGLETMKGSLPPKAS